MSNKKRARKLPEILSRKSKFWTGSFVDSANCVEALGKYYQVEPAQNRSHDLGGALSEYDWRQKAIELAREASYWRDLAFKLAADVAPAFLKPNHVPEPMPVEELLRFAEDWEAAGGTDHEAIPRDPNSFYQAQFVLTVRSIAAKHKKSERWAFQWFANKQVVTTPEKAKERLALLPGPYRARRTAGSLKEAFDTIPKHVRDNPTAFVPVEFAKRMEAAG